MVAYYGAFARGGMVCGLHCGARGLVRGLDGVGLKR